MGLTVYIDVLFAVNFIINYILLSTTARVARLGASHWRLALGALFGALYAVFMFFPPLKFIYSALAKLLFSLGLIAITFGVCKIRLFLKVLGVFYIITLSFGGAALAIIYYSGVGAALGAVISNGILYFNLPWQTLLFAILAASLVLRFVWRAYQSKTAKDNLYARVIISFSGEQAELDALIDTGNELYDPLSNYPVIVAEYQKLKKTLPGEICSLYDGRKEGDFELLSGALRALPAAGRFRLIPFSSLGREHGIMLGFKPDRAQVVENEKTRDLGAVIIGICNKKLANDESYQALLHPGML